MQRALPRLSVLAARARLFVGSDRPALPASSSTCTGVCFVLHAWAQAVVGALLPLAVLWVLEERARCCELQLWQRQLLERQQRQRSGEPVPALVAVHPGGLLESPLSAGLLVVWLTASAWALWLALEVALL